MVPDEKPEYETYKVAISSGAFLQSLTVKMCATSDDTLVRFVCRLPEYLWHDRTTTQRSVISRIPFVTNFDQFKNRRAYADYPLPPYTVAAVSPLEESLFRLSRVCDGGLKCGAMRRRVDFGFRFLVFALVLVFYGIKPAWSSYRYYNTYITFGSGDTMISTLHAHGGSFEAHRKWNVECMDGEAIVGINDWQEDFSRIQTVWCKFTFPLKPHSNGAYPYYPGCHVRNMTDQYFCYDPQRHAATSNTFMTGIWAGTSAFYVYRTVGTVIADISGLNDNFQPIKCCKTPTGYYIDYVSCYYMPTHDMYWEYYDASTNTMVFCAQGYVMVAAAKKMNPYRGFEYTIDWIQCCRVGFGEPVNVAPPIIYSRSGSAAYYAPRGVDGMPPVVVGPYREQYRRSQSVESEGGTTSEEIVSHFLVNSTDRSDCSEE